VKAKAGQHPNAHFFVTAKKEMKSPSMSGKVKDRMDDHLPRAVVGHVPAALRRIELDPFFG